MNPKVSILILNWFYYERTIHCVKSIMDSDYDNFEVVIIDNNSKNDSVKKLQEAFPNLKIIASNKNLGYAGGNYLGVQEARKNGSDFIWILNNDTKIRKNALTELIHSFQNYGEAIYSNLTLMSESPDIIHYSGSYEIGEDSIEGYNYDKLKGRLHEEVKDDLTDKEARIYGHSLLIPFSIINKYGFMDLDYFMFLEETDYFKSLLNHGVKTRFVKESIIVHESSASFKSEDGSLKNSLKSILLYYSKRNTFHYKLKWNEMTKSEILASRGGIINLSKFFLKNLFRKKNEKYLDDTYMWNLAVIHSLIGKRGCTIDPNDYL